MIDRKSAAARLHFHGLFDQLVWHGVIMLVVLDVIIDMHEGLFDLGVLISGQR